MYQYKSTKYKLRYRQLLHNYKGGSNVRHLTKEENDLIMTYLTDLYTSSEFRILRSYKPHEPLVTNSNTDSDDNTDDECCQMCTDNQYCSECLHTSTCGCRMTALFFYIGYHYIISNIGDQITIDNLDNLEKVPMIRHILGNTDSYYDNNIIGGILTRKQQAQYNNKLVEGANIVGIFQKFNGNDPNAHAFHYLFVLKNGQDVSIRQSWYDGGTSNIQLDFIQLGQVTNLEECKEMVTRQDVTKDMLLSIYGVFLDTDMLENNIDTFPIYVLN